MGSKVRNAAKPFRPDHGTSKGKGARVDKSMSFSGSTSRASSAVKFLKANASTISSLLADGKSVVLSPSGMTFQVTTKPAGKLLTRAPSKSPLDGALAAARERGRLRVAEILAGPEMLSADALAERLGTTRVTVNAKRQKRQLLGLEGPKRGIRFPEWQLDDDGNPFAALAALFDRLGDSPWAVYRFLVQRHAELDGLTGVEALRRGLHDEVIEAADSVGQALG